MLPDALKKVRGRGSMKERWKRKKKGESEWREQNAIAKMLIDFLYVTQT